MIRSGPSDFVKDARRQFDAISTRRLLPRWQRAPMGDGPWRSPRASKESKSFESSRQHAQGFKKAGLARGVKRKAEQVIKKELNKHAKKALSNKNVRTAVQVASALFPKQAKKARDIFGV